MYLIHPEETHLFASTLFCSSKPDIVCSLNANKSVANVTKQVSIFQACTPEFLHDLVLKMKAFVFTPGDMICRKGEVAREMFIIADGLLEVTRSVMTSFTRDCRQRIAEYNWRISED
jgi:hypothetical protein